MPVVVGSLMNNRAFCLGSWGSKEASELGTRAGEQNRVEEPQSWQWEEAPGSGVGLGWGGTGEWMLLCGWEY